METLTDIFSHFCGQKSGFVAGGAVLPVCQRCLGLYVGAAVTGVWMAVCGLWRRGLPSWSVFLLNEVMLLAAMLGGAHVWGSAPAAKLACGLWTGHVAALWLIGGAGHLWRLSRPAPPGQLPWRLRDKLQALAAAPILAALAWAIPHGMFLGWGFWAVLIVAGAVLLAAAATAAIVALATYLATRLRRRAAAA